MSPTVLAARVRRGLKRLPRRATNWCWRNGRKVAQRPWASIAPLVLSEAALLRAAGARDVDELWERLAAQPFFLRPADRAAWVTGFTREYPDASAAIVAAADRTLRHEFDLLGSGPQLLGPSLPWSTDFKTGREWPAQYCDSIQYNELDRPSDVKVPWELSRCQHFARLGQAYWLTGDDRYAQEFVAEVRDWLAANPYAWTVNWACAMDVGLRAVNWIWAFYFMADAPACRAASFRREFLRALYLHGHFVATHIQRHEVNGNHYLCDGVALAVAGSFFAATRAGRRWREVGRRLLVAEMGHQVTPDGVDFEQATAYHRLVLETFTTGYVLLERGGQPVPREAWTRLARMHDYVAAYTKPNGLAPLVGDADDGRIQMLGTQALNDHRYLLSTGAALFGSGALKAAAGAFWDESFWLLGPDGLDRFHEAPDGPAPARSAAFPDGGVFVLRSASAHVVVDCAEVGMAGLGGHGHNDSLSFELFMNGFNVVTDCGAYLYTASREWRNRFRSTAFHNTVQVDGEELNRFFGPDAMWRLHYDALPVGAGLIEGATADHFRGGHRGYERLAKPVAHCRELHLSRCRPRLLVRDRLDPSGPHTFTWRFHLDPAVEAAVDDGDVRLRAGDREVWVLPDAVAARFRLSLEPGWVSPSYGRKLPTIVLTWTAASDAPLVASFLFADTRIPMTLRAEACDELTSLSDAEAGAASAASVSSDASS